jgi:beta-lactamase class C
LSGAFPITYLNRWKLDQRRGRSGRVIYSNAGYMLLHLALERRWAELQGFYLWLGAGPMYSSAADMAMYLAANLGELPNNRLLQDAMKLTHQPILPIKPGTDQGMAWEVQVGSDPQIVDKYGGLENASAYIGLMTDRNRKLGIVLLSNRADVDVEAAGRAIIRKLAGRRL